MKFLRYLSAKFFSFMHGPGGRILSDAVASIIAEAGAVGASVLLEEAKRRVGTIDAAPGRGSIKAANVQEYLTAYAERVGIEASRSLINYTVEAALRAVRAESITEVK